MAMWHLPPSDSLYYTMENIARISALLESHPDHQFIIIGDVNCRFGKLRQSFISDKPVAKSWHYNAMDADALPNHNGKRLAAALAPLIVLNGLSTDTEQFISRATYRVGREWKSELDYCILSPRLVYAVKDFDWLSDNTSIQPCSDHCYVWPRVPKGLRRFGIYTMVERSKQLGQIDYSIPHTTTCKQIKMDKVDCMKFTDHLQALPA